MKMAWYEAPRGFSLRQKQVTDYFKPLDRGQREPAWRYQLSDHHAPAAGNPGQTVHDSSPSSIGLLGLPRHVFRIIMRALCADFIRDCSFFLNKKPDFSLLDKHGNLNEDSKPEWDGLSFDVSEECRFARWQELCPNAYDGGFTCKCPARGREFRELVTCCQAFWLELSSLFFSQNSFVVHRCAHGGMLGPLKTLGSMNLAALTSLNIVVNSGVLTYPGPFNNTHYMDDKIDYEYCECYCNDPVHKKPWQPYEFCLCEGVDKPLAKVNTGPGRRALQELGKVVGLLRSLIKPGQLELGIVCDCKNLTAAEAFVSVLHGLPKLRSCALRLSVTNDESLKRLAKQTVAKLTGNEQPLNLSGFALLSQELRTWILELTDLIAPRDIDVYPWWPHGTFTLQFYRQQRFHICEPVSGWNKRSISFAKSCHCWTFPSNLFLVNKEFYQEAKRIFFSQNHFILLPWSGRIHHLDEPDIRCYFNPLYWPRSVLQNLRSLQISLPLDIYILSTYYFEEYDQLMDTLYFWEYPDEHKAWRIRQDQRSPMWKSTSKLWASRLVQQLHGAPLNRLELTVDFRSIHRVIAHEPLVMLKAMFQRVVHVIAVVNEHGTGKEGFSKVFIYLPEGMEEKYAQALEKVIMGEGYDSSKNGKYLYPNRFEYWVDYVKQTQGSFISD
jgi:hypothetical protein